VHPGDLAGGFSDPEMTEVTASLINAVSSSTTLPYVGLGGNDQWQKVVPRREMFVGYGWA